MLERDGLKIMEIGQSAAKSRIEKGSTTIPCCGEVEPQAIGGSKR